MHYHIKRYIGRLQASELSVLFPAKTRLFKGIFQDKPSIVLTEFSNGFQQRFLTIIDKFLNRPFEHQLTKPNKIGPQNQPLVIFD
jgi:hypothetical protein